MKQSLIKADQPLDIDLNDDYFVSSINFPRNRENSSNIIYTYKLG